MPRHGRARGGAPAMWTGTISFGLIAIPVQLASAVRESEGKVSFHLLDDRDNSRLRRRMYCPKDEEIVPPDEIVRGAEVAPGKYVEVSDDELRAAAPERSETIEINEFVPLADIDPLYYDRPYWVLPKGAKKPYALLREVLAQQQVAGIAKFVLHAREHVVALRAHEELMLLYTLHFADEIRSAEDIAPKSEPKAAEVKVLTAAIKKLSGKFEPELLKDPHDEEVLAAVEKIRQQGEGKPVEKSAAKKTASKSATKTSAKSAKKPAAKSASKRRKPKLEVVAQK